MKNLTQKQQRLLDCALLKSDAGQVSRALSCCSVAKAKIWELSYLEYTTILTYALGIMVGVYHEH